jgi:fatty acid desaturase
MNKIFTGAPEMDRDDLVFSVKLILALSVYIVGACLCIFGNVIGIVTGVGTIGLTFAHSLELQHQCLHGTALSSRKLNRSVGFFLGLPSLVSFSHYKNKHMIHHKNLALKNKGEFFKYRPIGAYSTVGTLLRAAFDYRRIYSLLTVDGPAIIRNRQTGVLREARFEYICIGSIFSALLLASILFGQFGLFLLLWIVPLLLVSEPVHYLIELPEHYSCSNSPQDITHATRSITGSILTTWFTNTNNLHVEHHLYPGVPFSALPNIHLKIKDNLPNTNGSYFEFYSKELFGHPRKLVPIHQPDIIKGAI